MELSLTFDQTPIRRVEIDYTSSIKRNIENLSLIREICVFIGTL